MYEEDTIAAISTPPGSGGIAVIRLSGPNAIGITDQIFRGKIALTDAESHKSYLGKIVEPGSFSPTDSNVINALLDEALVTVFRAPHSYTKEDVVEISCHGGYFLSHRLLALLIKQGARLAEAGEFTQRAFLNGRIDLSQAEAVADLVKAKTELGLKAALSQFQGVLSNRVKKIRQRLIDTCSLLELELDFSEEDLEFANKREVGEQIQQTIRLIQEFLDTYRRGKILREGARLVIAGKPNVGKSSLLNALLKEERAIVTEIPGTTRDVLEEQLDIRGVLFRVVDTAGVRSTDDLVEQKGVQRTLEQIKQADILLFLFDGSKKLAQEDAELIEHIFSLRKQRPLNTVIAALNKTDLGVQVSKTEIRERVGNCPVIQISALEHFGFSDLEQVLIESALGQEDHLLDEPMVTNLRQKHALESALQSLHSAAGSLRRELSSEFISLDLRDAMGFLGEIIGEVTTEDILSNIFSKFCIGK